MRPLYKPLLGVFRALPGNYRHTPPVSGGRFHRLPPGPSLARRRVDGESTGSARTTAGRRYKCSREDMKMLKRTILALAVTALAFTGVAQAQENATLTLRSGDKVSGQLVDLGGVGFTVRVNGAERQIPTGEV